MSAFETVLAGPPSDSTTSTFIAAFGSPLISRSQALRCVASLDRPVKSLARPASSTPGSPRRISLASTNMRAPLPWAPREAVSGRLSIVRRLRQIDRSARPKAQTSPAPGPTRGPDPSTARRTSDVSPTSRNSAPFSSTRSAASTLPISLQMDAARSNLPVQISLRTLRDSTSGKRMVTTLSLGRQTAKARGRSSQTH